MLTRGLAHGADRNDLRLAARLAGPQPEAAGLLRTGLSDRDNALGLRQINRNWTEQSCGLDWTDYWGASGKFSLA